MFTITTPHNGTWNAITHDAIGPMNVVLENFKIHPATEGVIRRRTSKCSTTTRFFETGTPVTILDNNTDGVVVHTTGSISYVETGPATNRIVVVAHNETLAYRMNMTIDDDLSTVPHHVVNGYIVPRIDGDNNSQVEDAQDHSLDIAKGVDGDNNSQVEDVEDYTYYTLKLTDIKQKCTNLSHNHWKNKKLVDVVTYRRNEDAFRKWCLFR